MPDAQQSKDGESVPAIMAESRRSGNPLLRSRAGLIGSGVLLLLVAICVGSLPWTLSSAGQDAQGRALPARYKHGDLDGYLIPPFWAPMDKKEVERLRTVALHRATDRFAQESGFSEAGPPTPSEAQVQTATPRYLMGTDKLGRSLFVRCLTGGGVSIGIGIAAATISVLIGTLYGTISGYAGGRTDAVMMRIVDILYGLPYLLLVVLLAVAGDSLIDRYALATKDAGGELSGGTRSLLEVLILLAAIGGLSWLTMARVIRGQVLSLKAQPFMEAARAMGLPLSRQFLRHLLPNLLGPIIVYATLTVPQAILQESFLSFLGIGVRPPLPSWGNLASDGLVELNTVKIRWWLIVFPSLLLGVTLLALNFVGEGLREAFDPKRSRS